MYHIILNPASRSGKGIQIWKQIEPFLEKDRIRYILHTTSKQGDATEFSRSITQGITASLTLVVLGGDGTLNEVIQGIQNYELVRIGYIPTGSGNDFARALKLPKKLHAIYDLMFHSSHTQNMDMGVAAYEEKERFFVVSGGIGFDAAVCHLVNVSGLKDKLNHLRLGKLTYLGIALGQLLKPYHTRCELKVDQNAPVIFENLLFVTAMIQKFEGGGFLFCPDAKYNDGELDICCVNNIRPLKALCILPTAFFGKHTSFKEISIYRGKKLEIKVSEPLHIHTDGEVETKSTLVTFTCLPNKVNFIC